MIKQLDLFAAFAAAEVQPVPMPAASKPVEVKKEPKPLVVNYEECALLKQWRDIKEQYPDALLLFRVGDFYEIYNEDAEKASKILGITLTNRGRSSIKFCGFPYNALDAYLPKLVRQGCRVAICDEIGEDYEKHGRMWRKKQG
jgi:DNA mismatch repair ATPase MutS